MDAQEEPPAPSSPALPASAWQRFVKLVRKRPIGAPCIALLASLVLGVGVLGWQATTLRAPLCGEHNWRQADTYSAAYNFVHEGARFFYPQIDWTRGRSGVMGMETPVYAYMMALLMRLFGDGPVAGRLLSWLSMVAGLVAMFVAFRPTPQDWASEADEAQPNPLWVPCGIVVFAVLSPLFFFEGRQIQPDPMMAGLTAVAAACFHAFAQRERWQIYAWGLVTYCVAVGAKSPAVIAGPALWLLTFSASPRFHWSKPLLRGLPFALPLALFWGWDRWAHHLNETFNGGEAYFAIAIDWVDLRNRLRDRHVLEHAFGFVFTAYAANWVLAPVLVTGLALGFRKGLRALSLPLLLWLAMGAVLCAGSERLTWHWYYTFMMMAPLFYFGGVGVAAVFEALAAYERTTVGVRWGLWNIVLTLAATGWAGGPLMKLEQVAGAGQPPGSRWTAPDKIAGLLIVQIVAMVLATWAGSRRSLVVMRWLAPVALAGACFVGLPRALHDLNQIFLWRSRAEQWPDFAKHWKPMRRALDEVSSRKDVFVVDGANPWYLFLALRRGLVQFGEPDPGALAAYAANGARFYLHYRQTGPLPGALVGRPLIRSGELWELYCLAPDGCRANTK